MSPLSVFHRTAILSDPRDKDLHEIRARRLLQLFLQRRPAHPSVPGRQAAPVDLLPMARLLQRPIRRLLPRLAGLVQPASPRSAASTSGQRVTPHRRRPRSVGRSDASSGHLSSMAARAPPRHESQPRRTYVSRPLPLPVPPPSPVPPSRATVSSSAPHACTVAN